MTSRRGVVDFSAFRTGRSGWSDELEDGLFAAALPPVGGLTCSLPDIMTVRRKISKDQYRTELSRRRRRVPALEIG